MIVYLHGFRSSPQSFKARLLAARLSELERGDEWLCPALPVSPKEAVERVEREVAAKLAANRAGNFAGNFAEKPAEKPAEKGHADERVTLIGSSLGGFFATWLAEKHGWRAVLLNPAVVPDRDLSKYLGEQPLWHGGGSIVVEPRHLDELRALAVATVTQPARYYLIAATGDEVLDYREMLAHYPGAATHLIEGSDHGISEFADYVDEVLRFCDAP